MRWSFAIGLVVGLTAAPAYAGDRWTTVKPGIDYLERSYTDDDGNPQKVYAAKVDLTVPNVGLHVSSNTQGDERKVTTDTFAENADVVVAINGDWSDGNTPVGLAISDGTKWHNHIPDDTLGSTWGFLGCTATKDCTIDRELPLDEAWWFANPTLPPYRYFQAVGMNSEKLVTGGVAERGCYDTSTTNPRSAACLDATGTVLWLVVIDGRQSSAGASGMTCDETRALLIDLGCHEAAMFDGGGSSTLVVNGRVKNSPSDGSPRTVANHLGILYSDTVDARCTVANGRWCDGTTISTCQGGRYLGSGDCAVYGASCEEDGDWAYCVDYRCPSGSGQGVSCLDGSRFAYCSDGTYAAGDCADFGLACGTDASGSACMDSRCAAGPSSTFCLDGTRYAACSGGVYAEGDCAASGLTCWNGGGGAACIDARCPDGADGETCSGNTLLGCDAGAYHESDCAASGLVCDASAGCVPPISEPDSGAGTPVDTGPADMPGQRVAMGEAGDHLCGIPSAAGAAGALLAAFGALARRRRRTSKS